jgi:hypothetical protein
MPTTHTSIICQEQNIMEYINIFHDAYEWQSLLIILDVLDYLLPNVLDKENASLTSMLLQQQQMYTPLYIHQDKVISDHLCIIFNNYGLDSSFDNNKKKNDKWNWGQ